ncbi:hypothetical protein SADUNF_Sadunf18G0048200 [Salix dunnii]|uniref:Uncharacterized protein n=1 Tax=Salix dunnii TaxID=1413687 RepID=A0A835MG67_9ROSI|nr:hypothetical protein SADUNF_Sadunf18G0048200 [Salix dunnii]
MDFHYLSRKEFQDLCKKNKIPANMANVAIAEALEVLHKGVYKSRSAMGLKEKERVRPLKMDGLCWVIEDVETKDESEKELQIAEKRYPVKPAKACYFFRCRILRAVTSLYRRDTQIFKFQQKTELHFLQEESYSHRYELEAYNPKQEMGSEKDSPTLIKSQFVENKRHDNYDLQSYFAIVEESHRNQSDEAKENGGMTTCGVHHCARARNTAVPGESYEWITKSSSNFSGRMAPAVAARGKVEVQNEHKSVQKVYSTRSAVRLLEKAAEFSYCKSIKKRRSLMNNLSTTDAGKLRMLKRRMRVKRNIKRELQEQSLSNRYELEDYNPQQEMGSKKDLYSEVLSLDNASEINNELEKDEKSRPHRGLPDGGATRVDATLCEHAPTSLSISLSLSSRWKGLVGWVGGLSLNHVGIPYCPASCERVALAGLARACKMVGCRGTKVLIASRKQGPAALGLSHVEAGSTY